MTWTKSQMLIIDLTMISKKEGVQFTFGVIKIKWTQRKRRNRVKRHFGLNKILQCTWDKWECSSRKFTKHWQKAVGHKEVLDGKGCDPRIALKKHTENTGTFRKYQYFTNVPLRVSYQNQKKSMSMKSEVIPRGNWERKTLGQLGLSKENEARKRSLRARHGEAQDTGLLSAFLLPTMPMRRVRAECKIQSEDEKLWLGSARRQHPWRSPQLMFDGFALGDSERSLGGSGVTRAGPVEATARSADSEVENDDNQNDDEDCQLQILHPKGAPDPLGGRLEAHGLQKRRIWKSFWKRWLFLAIMNIRDTK